MTPTSGHSTSRDVTRIVCLGYEAFFSAVNESASETQISALVPGWNLPSTREAEEAPEPALATRTDALSIRWKLSLRAQNEAVLQLQHASDYHGRLVDVWQSNAEAILNLQSLSRKSDPSTAIKLAMQALARKCLSKHGQALEALQERTSGDVSPADIALYLQLTEDWAVLDDTKRLLSDAQTAYLGRCQNNDNNLPDPVTLLRIWSHGLNPEESSEDSDA